MKSSVIIKGNKYGFQIVLNPTLPFEELLREVAVKFQKSTGFFESDRPVAISFEGRILTEGEQNVLVDTITENSGLTISYIISGDEAVETRFARAISRAQADRQEREPLSSEEGKEPQERFPHEEITKESLPEKQVGKDGQFYRGTLRSGQKIEVSGSLVVLGDINPGAQIVAGGNVVILGCLKGSVYAGYPDDKGTFVAALLMEPMQIQIGTCIARSPDDKGKKFRLGRKKEVNQLEARMAFVENDNIFIETITRSLINEISLA